MKIRKFSGGLILVLIIITVTVGIFSLIKQPRNDRKWQAEFSQLATAEIDQYSATINNVRDARYNPDGSIASLSYQDRTYYFSELRTLDFFVEPFWAGGAAHTLLSFGFSDELGNFDYVTLSVEIRKEVDEEYSAIKGLMNEYEIIYIWADEKDVLPLRTDVRGSEVLHYRLDKVDNQVITDLFIGLLQRTNKLATEPEYYNTLFKNCTSSLWYDVNAILKTSLPFTTTMFLPEKSGEFLIKQGYGSDHEFQGQAIRAKVESDNYSEFIRQRF